MLVTIVGIKVQERGKLFCFKYVHERFSIPVKVGKSKGMGWASPYEAFTSK